MFSPWLLNVLLIVGIAFSINRTVQRDTAIRALVDKVGMSTWTAERIINTLPASALKEIADKGTLAGVNMEGVDLSDIDFSGLYMQGARLRGATLDRADFTMTDLSQADLREASLWGTNFINATLFEARLQGAYLEYTDFTGANLREASLWDASGSSTNFTSASLSEAWVIDADLYEPNFSSTDLSSSLFYATDLTTAIFDNNTQLRGVRYNSDSGLPSWLDPPSYYGFEEGNFTEDWFFWTDISDELQAYRNGSGSDRNVVGWLWVVPAFVTDSYINDYNLPEEIVERVK